ncbi:MAG: acyl carrier protein [Nitrospirae bacterium]|nr:acyl carrier protein [Nitrospirota bacterium]MDA1304614.1 acyl carrier protein [Nitrospirota bacterium]
MKDETVLDQESIQQGVQDWLINYVANELKVDPPLINPTHTFDQLGLDSVTTVALTGELEGVLGRSLSPSLPYEYPSIEALANFLALSD